MLRVVVIDDYEAYGQMAAGPLMARGHAVKLEIAPIDFDDLLAFKPQVIVVGLYRQETAFDRPVKDFEADVLGHKPVVQLEGYPAIASIPILLLGSALHEHDVPTRLKYDTFLVLPRDIAMYADRVEALGRLEKRRKLSPYTCPNPTCRARLVELTSAGGDLFCPRCGTGVAIDGANGHYMLPGENRTHTVPIAGLAPTRREAADG